MKRYFSKIALLQIIAALVFFHAGAQLKLYEVLPDAEEKKYLRGIVTVSDIKTDTSFGWYAQNVKYYKANAALVEAFKTKAGKFQLVLFAGTWCHDSQAIIPKYITCAEAAGLADSVLTIVAADRQKTTLANLHKVFNVTLVPTMIVMQDGKEIGRVTEYGKTGLPDAELAEIMGAVH